MPSFTCRKITKKKKIIICFSINVVYRIRLFRIKYVTTIKITENESFSFKLSTSSVIKSDFKINIFYAFATLA